MARKQYRINLSNEEYQSLLGKARAELGDCKQGLLSRFIRHIAREPIIFLDKASKKELKKLYKRIDTQAI